MLRVAVGLGVDGDGGDAELVERADDADGDLATVGDQDLGEHGGEDIRHPVDLPAGMTRARGWILAVACATLFAPVFADTAGAAVPRHLLGMNVDGAALAPNVHMGRQLRAIRQAGAGSVRWSLDWRAVQPYRSWDQVPADRRGDFTDVNGAPDGPPRHRPLRRRRPHGRDCACCP